MGRTNRNGKRVELEKREVKRFSRSHLQYFILVKAKFRERAGLNVGLKFKERCSTPGHRGTKIPCYDLFSLNCPAE
jgi:hypothetical protein